MDSNVPKLPVDWPRSIPAVREAKFPLVAPSKGKVPVIEDESEWEFEYSTTEKETYYLTVDMSHQGMYERTTIVQSNPRGGYRAWFNPIYGNPNQNARPQATNTAMFDDDEEENGEDDAQLPPREDGINGDHNIDFQLLDEPHVGELASQGEVTADGILAQATQVQGTQAQGSQAQGSHVQGNQVQGQAQGQETAQPQAVAKGPEDFGDLQILDLHSENPMISYRGRNFSASWGSNIGTEFLFIGKAANKKHTLPAIRHLPGDVDLLAVSSARLLTKPGLLKPNMDGEPRGVVINRSRQADLFRNLRKESNLSIRVDFDKNGTRKPQARFLETLMAIKRKRGEMDMVTTHPKETTRNYVENDSDELKEQEKKRKNKIRHKKRQAKAVELNGGVKPPSRKGRVRGYRKTTHEGRRKEDDFVAKLIRGDSIENENSLSVPTPTTWEELGIAQQDGAAEDKEMGEYNTGDEASESDDEGDDDSADDGDTDGLGDTEMDSD